ncbi:MAG: alpha-(1-_3)-arabinofuranosyltransferase domain-containing protein, partial [Sulfobacillus sp.]
VAVLYVCLHGLGLSMLHVQQVWFSLVVGASAVGMLFLYRCWWEDASSLRAMAAALLYGFSPYLLLDLKGASVLLIPYAALPWLTLEVVQIIRRRRYRYVVGAVVVGGLLAPGINPPLNAIMFIATAGLALAELKRQRWRRDSIGWLVATAAGVLVVSTWWIGPFIDTIRAGGASAYFVTDPLTEGAANSSFRAVLRLSGLWALYQGWDGTPYYPAQGYLLSAPVVALTLLAPFATVLAMRRFWKDIRVKVLAALVMVAVPLAVSIYPAAHPSLTGQLYLWVYSHVFVFRAFRSTYKWVWLLAFAYALLVPTLLRALPFVGRQRYRLAQVLHVAAASTIACLLIGYGVPFGQVRVFPASYSLGSIPRYWYQATAWLDQQSGPGRVLFTPAQGFSNYDWGTPEGDIAPFLMQRPEITPTIGLAVSAHAQALLNLAGTAPTDPSVPFGKVLSLLGVRYVVQRNDVNWQYYGSPSPKEMRAFLDSQPYLRRVATFGKLDIYEVRSRPHSVVGVASAVESVVSDQGFASSLAEWRPGTMARFGTASVENPAVRAFQSSSVWNGLTDQYGPQMAF